MLAYTYSDVSKMIDHSLLNPSLTLAAMIEGIQLAVDYDVASVCILPYALRDAANRLMGTGVKASTTIGFPHGGHTTAIKLAETRQALADGGEELDMVVNISAVLSGRWDFVKEDIRTVVDETHASGQRVKVIFENAYLNDEQKIRLCELCTEVNADWVKTSTGYAATGATHEDLALMRKNTAPHIQVKAAGGIRDLDALLAVRELGVSRCGATRTAAMMDEARSRLGLDPIIATIPGPTPPLS
jgi:deoxyribose-phosphate aldolase